MSPKKKTETEVVSIPKISRHTMLLTLVGDSSLVSHRWSKKAKQEMLDKQMKKAKQAKAAKNPAMDYAESLYLYNTELQDEDEVYRRIAGGDTSGVEFCFPSVAFKSAAVSACRFADGVAMTQARGAFHVMDEYTKIETSGPYMREDMVMIGKGTTADLRYRGEFRDWKATLKIDYNVNAFSPEQIMNLFNIAGFGVGVGEWRPEKNGSHGLFHVASTGE